MRRPTDEQAREIVGMMRVYGIQAVPPPYGHLSRADLEAQVEEEKVRRARANEAFAKQVAAWSAEAKEAQAKETQAKETQTGEAAEKAAPPKRASRAVAPLKVVSRKAGPHKIDDPGTASPPPSAAAGAVPPAASQPAVTQPAVTKPAPSSVPLGALGSAVARRKPPRLRVFFLRHFRVLGDVRLAADRTGIALSTLYRWRARDAPFRARWDELAERRRDMAERTA